MTITGVFGDESVVEEISSEQSFIHSCVDKALKNQGVERDKILIDMRQLILDQEDPDARTALVAEAANRLSSVWGNESNGAEATQAQKLLRTLTRMFKDDSQMIVASIVNHAPAKKAGGCFIRDMAGILKDSLEGQQQSGEEFSLSDFTDNMEDVRRTHFLEVIKSIRHCVGECDANISSFVGDVLNEEFGIEKKDAKIFTFPAETL